MTEPSVIPEVSYSDELSAELTNLAKLLTVKHYKYGANNLKQFGEYGILVRCSDKLARLQTLLAKKEEGTLDETIDDTWRDLAGYAIQAILLRSGKLYEKDIGGGKKRLSEVQMSEPDIWLSELITRLANEDDLTVDFEDLGRFQIDPCLRAKAEAVLANPTVAEKILIQINGDMPDA